MDSELLSGLGAPNLFLLASEFCLAAQQNSKQQDKYIALFTLTVWCNRRVQKTYQLKWSPIQKKAFRDTQITMFFTAPLTGMTTK